MSALRRPSVALVFLAGVMAGAILIGVAGEKVWSKARAEETSGRVSSGNWAVASVGDNWYHCWVVSPEGKLYTVNADRRMEKLEVKGILDLTKAEED